MSDTLLKAVIDESAVLEELTALLLQEEQALVEEASIDTLRSLIEKKMKLHEQVLAFEQECDAHLRARGLPTGWHGMQTATEGNPLLARYWSGLQAIVARARRLNAKNGQAIQMRLSPVYGADGRFPSANRRPWFVDRKQV